MTKVIAARVDLKTVLRIQNAVENSHTDKSVLLRILITKGLNELEQEDALERYKNGEISLGKFAEELKITKWDALSLLHEKGIHLPYTEEDLRDDLSTL